MGQQGSKGRPSLRTDFVRDSAKMRLGSFRRERSPTSGSSPRRIVANGRGGQRQGRVNSFQEKNNCFPVATINLEKSPTATRKQPITRRVTANVPAKQSQQRQQQQQQQQQQRSARPVVDKDNNTNGYAVTRRTIETCDQAAQTETPYDVLNVKRAEQVVEALSVTVQYLAYGLDAFSTPKLKKNYENMKTEWLTACAEVDELRARHVSMEERLNTERKDHRRALDQLREDLENRHAEQITALEGNLQEERQKWELRLNDTLNEATKEHRAVIARLRAEHEAELTRKDSTSAAKAAPWS